MDSFPSHVKMQFWHMAEISGHQRQRDFGDILPFPKGWKDTTLLGKT